MSNPYRPDPNRTHTEAVQAVAEAIWRVDGARPSRFPFSDLGDACAYRAMAEVAIEAYTAALGLTEEDLWEPVAKDGTRWPRRSHRAAVEALHSPCPEDVADEWKVQHIERVSRLVTPWVAVPDSGGEQ